MGHPWLRDARCTLGQVHLQRVASAWCLTLPQRVFPTFPSSSLLSTNKVNNTFDLQRPTIWILAMPEWAQPQVGLCFDPWKLTRNTVSSQACRVTQSKRAGPNDDDSHFHRVFQPSRSEHGASPTVLRFQFSRKGMSLVAAQVFGSSAVRRSFESCIRSLLKLCRAWDYCGFRVFSPPFPAPRVNWSRNLTLSIHWSHPKSCALRQSDLPFVFYVCVIVCLPSGSMAPLKSCVL